MSENKFDFLVTDKVADKLGNHLWRAKKEYSVLQVGGTTCPAPVQWELSECLFAFYRQKEFFFLKTPEKYQYNSMTKYQLQKKISVHGFTRALNTPDTYFSPHSDLQQHCCLSCALILLPQAQSVLSPELWRPVFDSNNKIKEETGELAN